MRPALKVLYGEHLALRGVARVLLIELKNMEKGSAPDYRLLRDVINYISEFPATVHHPKEEQYLFSVMRNKLGGEDTAVLNDLLQQHQDDHDKLERLEQALDLLEQSGGSEALVNFIIEARAYMDFLSNHIRLENEIAFPRAEVLLTDDEWARVDEAFAKNNDPLVGGDASNHKYQDLHDRILKLATPPMGLK